MSLTLFMWAYFLMGLFLAYSNIHDLMGAIVEKDTETPLALSAIAGVLCLSCYITAWPFFLILLGDRGEDLCLTGLCLC